MTTTSFAAGTYAAAQNLMSGGRSAGLAEFGSSSTGLSGGASLSGASGGGLDFGSLVKNAIEGVSQAGKSAETQAVAAATGKADLVDVVTAVAESETALQTLVSVRDRMISAYEEIMRMQI